MVFNCPKCNEAIEIPESIQEQLIECPCCHNSIPNPNVSQKEGRRSHYRYARLFIRGIWLIVALVLISMLVGIGYFVTNYVIAINGEKKEIEKTKSDLMEFQDVVVEQYSKTVGTLAQNGTVPDMPFRITYDGIKEVETSNSKVKHNIVFYVSKQLYSIDLSWNDDADYRQFMELLNGNES